MEVGSFEAVITEFSKRVAELREATLLRVDDTTSQLYAHDLEAIEGTVRALELKLRDIRAFVKREKEAIPQVEAVIAACQLQRQHLLHISHNMPTYLPSLEAAQPQGSGSSVGVGAAADKENARDGTNGAHEPAAAGAVKKRAPLAKRYITHDELNSLSAYMRGRLTADKINAALDELVGYAEANAALVAAARKNRGAGADKRHAQWLLYNVANHESCKGRAWVVEGDLKSGTHLRLDKTGKGILTVLRHLNRCQEVRITVEGSMHLVYVLL
ncbi:hypothetical protein N2152v2_003827 [Parachlorella kessleri]